MSSEREKVEELLSIFWDEQVIPIAHDPEMNSTVDDMAAPLDSISACEVLVLIEPLIGRELKAADVIQKGGYTSKEEFVKTLTQAVFDSEKTP
jgi:hypothetical protein